MVKLNETEIEWLRNNYPQMVYNEKRSVITGLFFINHGYNGIIIKDCFNIDYNLYDLEHIDIIDGYQCSDLITCYELKKSMNKPKDKKLIQKLELMVCSQDNYYFERKLRDKGIQLIAGVDEVGRGPLVGPVVAACVILPEEFSLEGLTDSKKLSEKKREYF